MALQDIGFFEAGDTTLNGYHEEVLLEEQISTNQALVFKPKLNSSGNGLIA